MSSTSLVSLGFSLVLLDAVSECHLVESSLPGVSLMSSSLI